VFAPVGQLYISTIFAGKARTLNGSPLGWVSALPANIRLVLNPYSRKLECLPLSVNYILVLYLWERLGPITGLHLSGLLPCLKY